MDAKRVTKFFAHKTVSGDCPFCKSPSWDVINFPQGLEGAIPGRPPRPVFSSQEATMPVVVLSCTNCGYIRLHSLSKIDELFSSLSAEEIDHD